MIQECKNPIAAGDLGWIFAVTVKVLNSYQDFNYVTEDSAWVHLEFESDAVTDEDLRRFREYEAATSRAYHVEVIVTVHGSGMRQTAHSVRT